MTLCTFGPPDERERRWILKFEDVDVDDMHFTAEPDAMRAFDRYSGAFTCTLFVTATFVDQDKRREPPDWDHRGVNTPLSYFTPRR